MTVARIFKVTVAIATVLALGAVVYLAPDWRWLGLATAIVLLPNLLLFAVGVYAHPELVRAIVQSIVSTAVVWRALVWWILALNSDKGGALSVGIYMVYEAFAVLVFSFVVLVAGGVSRVSSSQPSPSNNTVEGDARKGGARPSP